MHLKISSGKWRPFCLGLIVLNFQDIPEEQGQQHGSLRPQVRGSHGIN